MKQMSGNGDALAAQNSNFTLLSILSKEKLTGPNYMDWMLNLKMTLRYENKEYVLEKPLIKIDESTATPEQLVAYNKHTDDATKVACIMVATIEPELQKFYEDYWPYEMCLDLAVKFHKKAIQERYEVVKSLMVCKLKVGESVCAHVQTMQRYVERFEKLNVSFDKDLVIDMVLKSLPPSYDQFILTYHLNNTETTLTQLHNLLQTAESGMKKNHVPSMTSAPVLAIGHSRGKKRKATSQPNWKGKAHAGTSSSGSKGKPNFGLPAVSDPKEATCFHCGQKGHWRRSYPKYLQELKEGKIKPSGSSSGAKRK